MVTALSGHAALISPASSSPTGPAPSSRTLYASASAVRVSRNFLVAAAEAWVSTLAGNGYADPVASTM